MEAEQEHVPISAAVAKVVQTHFRLTASKQHAFLVGQPLEGDPPLWLTKLMFDWEAK